MAASEIIFVNGRPAQYTDYTIMTFSNWRALDSFAKYVEKTKPTSALRLVNNNFRTFINRNIIAKPDSYGINGKQPRSYEEAMLRNKFIYWDEYKKIKQSVEKKIRENLQKNSNAEAMKPKMVFNDKQIGEFIFDRAAMSLQPEIYFYSPTHKREVQSLNEKIIYKGDKMFLESDNTPIVYAVKSELQDGSFEFFELKGNGEEAIIEATKKGILVCTSSNKKVYLYKEKKPKIYNAIKIIVGLQAGGFTYWDNDFYTGMAAISCVEILESLGYSVHLEIAVGGGRCSGCSAKLNFKNRLTHGRRFFTFTAKSFDEQLDLDGLLYTVCDPSFHNVKFISLLNNFFTFFGDQLDPDPSGSPAGTWHGITQQDMINPIGMYHKYKDVKKGNTNLLHFFIWGVSSENDVIRQITDLVLNCENQNKEALIKYSNHDFGIN